MLARLAGARRRVHPADPHSGAPPAGGWEVVTINRPPNEVLPGGRRPEPLRQLGRAIQVDVWPAPAGRGTELAARIRPGATLPGLAAHVAGDHPDRVVRTALRQAKQLAETGEVLRADRSPIDRGLAG
ncbi:hypothetical protein [Salinispora sp. H7-4]|uniref:hypothetical protein n=1 Tax=Salinispora sp. H7-4 TaxID=2748321 RepID=UPI0015D1BF28|nr:hypothetical protein [Salinispora sp. H7-4]NYT94585.1 hypothetical protein [Salinispora sp. H7-4]